MRGRKKWKRLSVKKEFKGFSGNEVKGICDHCDADGSSGIYDLAWIP